MKIIANAGIITMCILALVVMTACAPEVGTEAWCKQMDKKPKGDWSANEVGDYAKHCIFK
jgi:hypothetical protein